MQELGASPEEMQEWENHTRAKMKSLGATQTEIDDYFGVGPVDLSPQIGAMRQRVQEASAPAAEGGEPKNLTFMQAMEAGWQSSLSGLASRQSLPENEFGAHEEIWDTIGFALAQGAGDLPVSVPAFVGTFFAVEPPLAGGGAAIGSVVPGAGTAAGAVGGTITALGVSGATSGAVTEGTREAYMEFLRSTDGKSGLTPREYAAHLTAALLSDKTLEGVKFGAATGAATSFAGPITRKAIAKPVSNAIGREVIVTTAEMTAAVTAASAIEGELPTAESFGKAAAIMLGVKIGEGAVGLGGKKVKDVSDRLQEHWVKTGERPEDVLKRAETEPEVMQAFLAGDNADEVGSFKMDADPEVSKDTPGFDTDVDGDVVFIDGDELIFNPSTSDVEAAKNADTTHSAIVLAAKPGGSGGGKEPPPPAKKPSAEGGEEPKKLAAPEDPEMKRLRDLDDDVEAIKDRIVDVPEKKGLPDFDDFRYAFINDLQHAVSQSARAHKAETGRTLSIESNPGELARLAAGAHAKADLALKGGVFNDKGQKVGDSLKEIVEGVGKGNAEDFLAYLVAKRVVEKDGQGIETGFDVDGARNTVENIGRVDNRRSDFETQEVKLQGWLDSGVERLVRSGLMSKDRAESMIRQNMDYVPFMRLMDDGLPPAGASVRGLPVRNPVKKIKGSDRPILNPLDVIVKNRYTMEQLAENNLARKRVVDFNNSLDPDNQFLERVTPKEPAVPKGPEYTDFEVVPGQEVGFPKRRNELKKLADSDTELKNFMEENGLGPDDLTGMHVYRAAHKRLDKNEFIVFEDGNPVIYKAKDPRLILSLQSLDASSTNWLIKMGKVPSAMLRSGTVLFPEFMAKSFVRDNMSSLLMNSFKVVPVYDAIIGMKHVLKGAHSEKYVQWVNNGGANSALLDFDQRVLSKGALDDQVHQNLKTQAWNVATSPYRLAAYMSTGLENSMRVGQFIRSQKAGKSDQTAALRSRDVSLDFYRMGANIRALNMVSAWLGATINGMDRAVGAFKRDPRGTAMKAAAFVTLPSILLWWANHEEDWYKGIDDWEKALFWHFNVGTKKDPTIMRIPMPQQFGTWFGYVPTTVLDSYSKDNPDVVQDIGEEIVASLNPLTTATPVAISPFLEIGTNHNMFTGKPLVSRAQESVLPEYRYTPYTSDTAKQLAKLTGRYAGGVVNERYRTPIAMDHYIRSWGGTTGVFAVGLVDKGVRAAQKALGQDVVEKPEATLADIPVVKAFFTRVPAAQGHLTAFYENANRVDQIKRTIKKLEEQSKFDEADRLATQFGGLIIKTAPVRTALSEIQTVIHGVHYDPDMSAAEKRQLIDSLTYEMIDYAEFFNEEFAEIRKEDDQ
jgi:hypothetical protein